MPAVRLEEVLQEFIEALVSGRYEELALRLTEDVVWHTAPSARTPPLEGRESMLEFLRAGIERCYRPPGSFKALMSVSSEREAMCLAELRLETRAGAIYENQYCFAARFEDGRISEAWELLDTANWARQLGEIADSMGFHSK
jgi:ketosteroid isomerase-like protein